MALAIVLRGCSSNFTLKDLTPRERVNFEQSDDCGVKAKIGLRGRNSAAWCAVNPDRVKTARRACGIESAKPHAA